MSAGRADAAQPQAGAPACSPSLVIKDKSRTWGKWDGQQRRLYRTLSSFFVAVKSEGYKCFAVHLTSAPGSDAARIAEHSKELMKRVKRQFGYEVVQLQVQTAEGHGVIHSVWAIKDRSSYIPQAWLSDQWNKIHGAHRVWINLIKESKHDAKRVTRYVINQYYAGQSAIRRFHYSWHRLKLAIGRGWSSFKKQTAERRPILWYERMWGRDMPVRDLVPLPDLVAAWHRLLEVGWCICDGVLYRVKDRQVQPALDAIWETHQSDQGRWAEWSDYE